MRVPVWDGALVAITATLDAGTAVRGFTPAGADGRVLLVHLGPADGGVRLETRLHEAVRVRGVDRLRATHGDGLHVLGDP